MLNVRSGSSRKNRDRGKRSTSPGGRMNLPTHHGLGAGRRMRRYPGGDFPAGSCHGPVCSPRPRPPWPGASGPGTPSDPVAGRRPCLTGRPTGRRLRPASRPRAAQRLPAVLPVRRVSGWCPWRSAPGGTVTARSRPANPRRDRSVPDRRNGWRVLRSCRVREYARSVMAATIISIFVLFYGV